MLKLSPSSDILCLVLNWSDMLPSACLFVVSSAEVGKHIRRCVLCLDLIFCAKDGSACVCCDLLCC